MSDITKNQSLTKQQLYDDFDGKISKTCLVPDQGEPLGYMIQGKYCWIQYGGDGWWNVFICNSTNLAAGLGQRRVNRIARILSESPTTIAVRMLNGECDVWVQGTDLILQNLKLLGIRKKRKYSQEQITARVKVLRGEE
jgi:hypothetical protein